MGKLNGCVDSTILEVNSKSWKLVFRGFPYMGMFD